mmetsp:Transcript_12804/g.19206  ORF Transcript_12804/g.19206 Transcript_12804/m.19206 type:complete len:426 (+) Transcript_12804:26-1303(+)
MEILNELKKVLQIPEAPPVVLHNKSDAISKLVRPLLADEGSETTECIRQKALGFIENCENDSLNRSIGCILGMAIADAVGAPLEFTSAMDYGPDAPRWDRKTNTYHGIHGNRFNLKRGQYTDDASMGIALCDSLLLSTSDFDGSDARIRWHAWWHFGYANAFLRDDSRSASVGLGGNIGRSLDALVPGHRPPPAVNNDSEDAGNGSIMRLAPVPVRFFLQQDKLLDVARRQSLATHPGFLAAECSAFLSFACARAINLYSPTSPSKFLDETIDAFLTQANYKTHDINHQSIILLLTSTATPSNNPNEQLWNWRSDPLPIMNTLSARGRSYNGYPNTPGYFGSFCMDALAMALHSFYHTTSFDAAIERCINFRGDADSTGSVTGQLAGAFYGASGIPRFLKEQLYVWDRGDTALRALLLWARARDI